MVESLMSKMREDNYHFISIKQHIDDIMNSTSLEKVTKMDMIYSATSTKLLKLGTNDTLFIKDFVPSLANIYEFVITKDTSVYIDEHDFGSTIVDKSIINSLNYLTQLINEGDYDTREEFKRLSYLNNVDDYKNEDYFISIHGNQVSVYMDYGVTYVFTRKNSNKYSLSITGYGSYAALNYYYNSCNIYFSRPYTKRCYDDIHLYVVGQDENSVYNIREKLLLPHIKSKKEHWWNKLFK